MHPGPINRGLELDDHVADGSNSVITEQVENGIFVRMATFVWVFDRKKPAQEQAKEAAAK